VLAYVGAATVFRVSELAEITAAVRARVGRRMVDRAAPP